MHISDAGLRLSAIDLAHFLSCRHRGLLGTAVLVILVVSANSGSGY
jgi:hypothetical protein